MKFFCLPAGSRVRVFTTSLWRVWDQSIAVPGTIEWDGRNLDGRDTAPGVYFYMVDFGDNRPRIIAPFTVIR